MHISDRSFVRTFVSYDQVESSSDCASAMVRQGTADLPMVVWARRQTRGRGRGGHAWWSDEGSLTFTVAIDPSAHGLSVATEPRLALATAVAVIDALGDLDLAAASLGIRWPNDLEVGDRKLGGILPERVETEHGRRILIGVGLNVLTDFAEAPLEVRRMATSLAEIHGKPLSQQELPQILSAILQHLSMVIDRLAAGDPALARRWDGLDLLRDRPVRVDLGTRIVVGRGCGVDADGALWLDDGRDRQRFFGGQVLRP